MKAQAQKRRATAPQYDRRADNGDEAGYVHDAELVALRIILHELERLLPDQRARVVAYVAARYAEGTNAHERRNGGKR